MTKTIHLAACLAAFTLSSMLGSKLARATEGLYDRELFDKATIFASIPVSIPSYVPAEEPWRLGLNLTILPIPAVFDDTSVKNALHGLPFVPKLALLATTASKTNHKFLNVFYLQTPSVKRVRLSFLELGGGIDWLLDDFWLVGVRAGAIRMLGLRSNVDEENDQLLVTGATTRAVAGIQTKGLVSAAYLGAGISYAAMTYRTNVNNIDRSQSTLPIFGVLGLARCQAKSRIDCISFEVELGTSISPAFLLGITI